jgi:DNA-binding transcriptional regulator YiaG
MPNVANVLREEIQRLAKKQVKLGLSPLKRDHMRLKKSVADLRRQVAALNGMNRELLKKVTPVVAEGATEKAATLRPTSKGLDKLRRRLGLTQVQFGRLLGVSGQAVAHWAAEDGRVRMRNATLAALAGIQNIGKREALRRLNAIVEPKPVREDRRQAAGPR